MTCEDASTKRRLSRRRFVQAVGASTLMTAGGPLLVRGFSGLAQPAGAMGLIADPLPPGTPILLVVDTGGGNDTLNMLCPVDDPWYYDASYGHGSLALSAAETLDLPGCPHRMHPSMPWLASRWQNGDVAFVEGVGETVNSEFSHFEAQDQWHTGSFDRDELRGWLGRYNDIAQPGAPLACISLGDWHPLLVGDTCSVLAVSSIDGFEFGVDWRANSDGAFLDSIAAMGTNGEAGVLGEASAAITQTVTAQDRIQDTYDESLLAGVDDWYAEELVNAAMMIRGGVPCQTYVAHQGGFDTHDNQASTHSERLARLDTSLQAFFAALAGSPRAADVTVLVYSEFGRKITQNGSAGTDHGQACTATLIGPRVSGGMFGEAPTLDPGGPTRPNRVHDAMVPTVDFRALLGTCVNFLGADKNAGAEVLDDPKEDLGMLLPIKADAMPPAVPPADLAPLPRPANPAPEVPIPSEVSGPRPDLPAATHERVAVAARTVEGTRNVSAVPPAAPTVPDDLPESGAEQIAKLLRGLRRGRGRPLRHF